MKKKNPQQEPKIQKPSKKEDLAAKAEGKFPLKGSFIYNVSARSREL